MRNWLKGPKDAMTTNTSQSCGRSSLGKFTPKPWRPPPCRARQNQQKEDPALAACPRQRSYTCRSWPREDPPDWWHMPLHHQGGNPPLSPALHGDMTSAAMWQKGGTSGVTHQGGHKRATVVCVCAIVSVANLDSVCISPLIPQLPIAGILVYNNKGSYNSVLVTIRLTSVETLHFQNHRHPVAQASGVHPAMRFSDSVLMMLQTGLWILRTAPAFLHLLLEQRRQQPGYLLVMWKEPNSRSFQSSLKNGLKVVQPPVGVLKAIKLPIAEKLEIKSQGIYHPLQYSLNGILQQTPQTPPL